MTLSPNYREAGNDRQEGLRAVSADRPLWARTSIANVRKDKGEAIRNRRHELFSETSAEIDGRTFNAVNTRALSLQRPRLTRRADGATRIRSGI
jgi:hypothetical protein